MTLLTVDYSRALVDLLLIEGLTLDGIEVGPWYTPEKITGFRQTLPGFPFYFHAGSLSSRLNRNKKELNKLQLYLECTQSPWVSFHIELLPLYIYIFGYYFGIYLSPPESGKAKRQFITLVNKIKEKLGLQIILENLPSLPLKKYNYAADPEIITEIVEQTASAFLLDIAHARIAATTQNLPVTTYIEKLPLDKTEQIHASGVRKENGRLRDAHETMSPEDFQLLEWILGKCNPTIVTLEYYRNKRSLREQILSLQGIINNTTIKNFL
jgi:uncharacterized protein (UPF0276 family)